MPSACRRQRFHKHTLGNRIGIVRFTGTEGLEIVTGKKNPRQKQGGPQPGIKDRYEDIRTQAGNAQADAECHHECHDAKGFNVKKLEKKLHFLLVL